MEALAVCRCLEAVVDRPVWVMEFSAEAEMVNALRKSLGPFILLDSSGLAGQTLIPSCLRRGAGGD